MLQKERKSKTSNGGRNIKNDQKSKQIKMQKISLKRQIKNQKSKHNRKTKTVT
jgi:hypothetical protein